jgi:hypothetical protein
MQTTHLPSSRPVPATAQEHRPFKTREQELYENDREAWIRDQLERPILKAFHQESQNPDRQDGASRLYFEHYVAFFREAELMELPLRGEFAQDWLALAFEGAFDFANRNTEQAEAWLDDFPSNREMAGRKFRAFTSLRWESDMQAHSVVQEAVRRVICPDVAVEELKATPLALIKGAEVCFWMGLFAATEARHNPEAQELVEWFAARTQKQWGDVRHHTHLIRKAALCGRQTTSTSLRHPLLRIAEEKYKDSLQEGAAIGELLEELSNRQTISRERDGVWREMQLARWIRDAAKWGVWMLRERPDAVREILATTNAFTGDALDRFYERVFDGVKDLADYIEVADALLRWQSKSRGHALTRYYGERIETVVLCVDAAVWLPWWLAQKKANTA